MLDILFLWEAFLLQKLLIIVLQKLKLTTRVEGKKDSNKSSLEYKGIHCPYNISILEGQSVSFVCFAKFITPLDISIICNILRIFVIEKLIFRF